MHSHVCCLILTYIFILTDYTVRLEREFSPCRRCFKEAHFPQIFDHTMLPLLQPSASSRNKKQK